MIKKILYLVIALLPVTAITACGSLVGASVGVSAGTVNDVGYTDPYNNPLYWNSNWYPGIGYYPTIYGTYPGPVRPHQPHMSWQPNPQPNPSVSQPVGNVRPPLNNNQNSNPNTPQINLQGSNPGLVEPPAGSGLHFNTLRH